jgi:hypothetical protein
LLAPKHVRGVFFLKGTPHWRKEGKQWSKNPLILSWGATAHLHKRRANLGGQNPHTQICGQDWFPDPPRHSTFKRGGGSGIGRASLNGLDQSTQICGQGWIPDPPCHSTFNKGGGGGSGIGGSRRAPHCHVSNILHLPPYAFHSVPSWPIPFSPFFSFPPVTSCQVFSPLILQLIFPPSFGPATLRLPCHFPMALCLVIRCHNPLPSIHLAPFYLITHSPPAMCLSFSPSRLHLYGHLHSLST